VIIKGNAVTGPQALARYLQSKEVNERAEIVEVRGTAASDPEGALIEMDAYAEGTRCQKPLYHAKINPEPPYRLTPEQRNEAIDLLEQRLGFAGHARVVVVHEKLNREHIHVIWSRIDLENMRAVSLSHNFRAHEEVSRELERRFGHNRVQGAHAERENATRPERTLSAAEMRQEERTGISAKNVKADVTAAFRSSDNAEAFRTALDDAGYVLAKGDRRDFVIVDQQGGVHSLGRRIEGMKAAELRAFMAPLDRDSLPTIEQAKGIAEDRERGVYSARDSMKWEDALAASAIECTQREDRENVELRRKRKESRAEGLIQKAYGAGEDYVHQTDAALKDFKHRTKKLNKEPRPYHPSEHVSPSSERETPDVRIESIIRDADARRRKEDDAARQSGDDDRKNRSNEFNDLSAKLETVERVENSEALQERIRRLLDRPNVTDIDPLEPDRQRAASGGGRTRSR